MRLILLFLLLTIFKVNASGIDIASSSLSESLETSLKERHSLFNIEGIMHIIADCLPLQETVNSIPVAQSYYRNRFAREEEEYTDVKTYIIFYQKLLKSHNNTEEDYRNSLNKGLLSAHSQLSCLYRATAQDLEESREFMENRASVLKQGKQFDEATKLYKVLIYLPNCSATDIKKIADKLKDMGKNVDAAQAYLEVLFYNRGRAPQHIVEESRWAFVRIELTHQQLKEMSFFPPFVKFRNNLGLKA